MELLPPPPRTASPLRLAWQPPVMAAFAVLVITLSVALAIICAPLGGWWSTLHLICGAAALAGGVAFEVWLRAREVRAWRGGSRW